MPEELMDSSNALGMLREEHEELKALLASCFETDDPLFKEQTLLPLMQELRVHSEIERSFFLPFLSKHFHPDLIRHAERDLSDMEGLAGELERIKTSDPQFDRTLELIMEKLQKHIFEEEQYLFVPSEGREPDFTNQLVRLATLMKERKAELHASMGRQTERIQAPDDRLRRAQEQGRNEWAPRDVLLEGESGSPKSPDSNDRMPE